LPRDILTPAATLVGLVVTAIGLSTAIATVSVVLQTLSVALVVVVILFVAAAFVTCVSSLRNSRSIFRVSVVLYAVGWVFTGIVVSLLLLGNAWSIQILQIQIPQIPSVDIERLLSSIFSVFSVILAVVIYRRSRIDRKRLISMTRDLGEDPSKTKAIVQTALGADQSDPSMAILGITIELERELRTIVQACGLPQSQARTAPMSTIVDYLSSKNVIDEAAADSTKALWRLRNIILHYGGDVSTRDARLTLALAANILAYVRTANNNATTIVRERGWNHPAFVYLDVVGYRDLELSAIASFEKVRAIANSYASLYGGECITTEGDTLLLLFYDMLPALRAAAASQSDYVKNHISVRMGIERTEVTTGNEYAVVVSAISRAKDLCEYKSMPYRRDANDILVSSTLVDYLQKSSFLSSRYFEPVEGSQQTVYGLLYQQFVAEKR
jgi:class 3 adenylate cyclase